MEKIISHLLQMLFYPEPRGPRVLPVDELVLWYGMFAPCGRLLGTMGFAHGAPLKEFNIPFQIVEEYHRIKYKISNMYPKRKT